MTSAQIEQWKVERDIARQSGDPELIQRAYDHRDDMMMECIQHQADRVKQSLVNDERLEGEIKGLQAALAPCVESDREYRAGKLMAKGAKWAVGAIIGISTVVGPVIAIKICKAIGVLW